MTDNIKQVNSSRSMYIQNEMVIFADTKGDIKVEVKLHNETVWLTLDQIAALFGRDKSGISRHIKNVFNLEELDKELVVAKFATTAQDKKTYYVEYYNLDMIISVVYRVNSKRGIEFRRWANNIDVIKSYSYTWDVLLQLKLIAKLLVI